MGRLSSEKHAADIVEALAKTDPALGLEADIVGGGDQEEPLKELAAELGIADRVHVLGKISDKELMDAYQRCTFFCMPSTAELQSIATLEALASRKPVVLADAVALPHLVRDGINGFLFPPRDIEELASRFTQICELSEDDLDAMARASLDVVAKHDIEYTLTPSNPSTARSSTRTWSPRPDPVSRVLQGRNEHRLVGANPIEVESCHHVIDG